MLFDVFKTKPESTVEYFTTQVNLSFFVMLCGKGFHCIRAQISVFKIKLYYHSTEDVDTGLLDSNIMLICI